MTRRRTAVTPDQLAFAKSLYVFGIEDEKGKRVFPTLRRVAKRTKIPVRVLIEHAQHEDWLQERGFAHEEFYVRMKEEMLQKLVEKSIELRTRLADGARVGINIVTARLGLIAREMTQDQHSTPKGARGFELRDLGMALETFKRIGLDSLGDNMAEEFTWRDLVTQAKGYRQDHEEQDREKEDTPPVAERASPRRRTVLQRSRAVEG
jgi:hypothetical protein